MGMSSVSIWMHVFLRFFRNDYPSTNSAPSGTDHALTLMPPPSQQESGRECDTSQETECCRQEGFQRGPGGNNSGLLETHIFRLRNRVFLPSVVEQLVHHLIIQKRQILHVPGRAYIHHPSHPLLAQLSTHARCSLAQLGPQLADLFDSFPRVIRETFFYPFADEIGEFGALAVC